jgi:redox-sensitive bicupin YhaK (pirin superfamily)
MPLVSGYEYAAVVLRGAIEVGPDHVLGPGKLGYLGRGRDELAVVAEPGTRAMLLGGEPFDEPILMWWNFVARDGAEFELAYRDWEDRHERFGTVTSQLPRIPAPPLATT